MKLNWLFALFCGISISQTSKENENWSSISKSKIWVENYSEINLTETTFGSSYAAEVGEIKIPLFSTSSEKKRRRNKNNGSDKKKYFFYRISTKGEGAKFRDCLPTLRSPLGLRSALIYRFIAYLINILSACLGLKCFLTN